MFGVTLSAGVGGGAVLGRVTGGQAVGTATLVLYRFKAPVYIITEKDRAFVQSVLFLAQRTLHRVALEVTRSSLLWWHDCRLGAGYWCQGL